MAEQTEGLCEFTQQGPGLFVCGRCLRPVRLPGAIVPPRRHCPKLPLRSRSPRPILEPAATAAAPAPAAPPPIETVDQEVARVFAEEEKRGGLGDIAERVAGRLGIARVTGYVERELGIDCNCSWRKRRLNALSNWVTGKGWTPGAIQVTFLTPTLGLGGAERWILSLCNAWADRKRVSVRSIALTDGAQSWEPFCVDAERLGVPVIGSRNLHETLPNATRAVTRLPDATQALRRAIEGTDVLIHWGIPHVGKLLDDVGYHGPSISVSHGSGQWTLDMTTQAVRGSNYFAAVSRPSRDAQPAAVRAKTKILWNGVDPRRVLVTAPRPETRAAWGLTDGDLALGYVGRLSQEKRPLAIAEAWRALGGEIAGRRVVPIWVGDGWQADKYWSEIRRTVGEAGRVIPATNEIGNVLAALDVYMLASPGEGFSVGLLEAWAAGTPAVATPVGAVPELEERFGQMTFGVPVNASPDELAAGVRAAVADGSGTVVERAQRVALEELTLAAMGNRWADWLEEIVG